ncbi:stage III sporulation protein AF [Bacillus sp. V-88]|uniref:stage III sporulation protein AF n=1 Tax=Rossellomorea vietnamensis TaxID=218284 RepID=UPI0005549B7D|nr:stage III sporulation protein AF [Rossellomorea vietnamensis]OXS62903.1 stage III sporulation protein AF [Bacillus sp. DSM 27956]PRX77736.1 stage III sporulation protein AF [Bacillus sp. V-88]SLK18556.1 stage III sporulation protein AF [Bacillus sp. V-88]
MSFLTDWITNIIIFVLLATVIDMLLPSSNMQKYAKIVTGLLLITIILTPLFKLMSTDFDEVMNSIDLNGPSQNKSMENEIEMKKKEIQASQRAYILEQMAVQMKQEAEKEMMDEHGKVIEKVTIQADDVENLPDSITGVKVIVKEKESEKDSTIEAVQNVEIDTGSETRKKTSDEDTSQLATLLAEQWNLTQDKIIITVEGGTGEGNEL